MKKTTKKLHLKHDTVRHLQMPQLGLVAGGVTGSVVCPTSHFLPCASDGTNCC